MTLSYPVSPYTYEVIEEHIFDLVHISDYKVGDRVRLVQMYKDKPYGFYTFSPEYVAIIREDLILLEDIDHDIDHDIRGYPASKLRKISPPSRLDLIMDFL